jgi:hypothetical protein
MTSPYDALKAAPVGARVRFDDERMPYTIQARNERYVILTKPFAARNTVIYTIVDFVLFARGPDDRIFSGGYETREECEDRLQDMMRDFDPVKVSCRRGVRLRVRDVRPAKDIRK